MVFLLQQPERTKVRTGRGRLSAEGQVWAIHSGCGRCPARCRYLGAQHHALSTCEAYGFAALVPGCVLLLPGAPVAPTSSVNLEGLNFIPGGSHLKRQLLQQVTEAVTCKPPTEDWPLFTRLPGPHSVDTAGCPPPREAHRQEAAALCALRPPGRPPPGSFLPPPCSSRTPSPESAVVLFLPGLVPIQTRSQQDPSGCP